MVPLERSMVVSYRLSIVTVALSVTIRPQFAIECLRRSNRQGVGDFWPKFRGVPIGADPSCSKVIDLGVNRKLICNFLLDINSNHGRISFSYRFHFHFFRYRDIDVFSSKIARFPTLPLFDTPRGGTPCDINVMYTPLKSTFNRLQFRR